MTEITDLRFRCTQCVTSREQVLCNLQIVHNTNTYLVIQPELLDTTPEAADSSDEESEGETSAFMATSPSPPQRRRGETRVSINCDLRDVEAAARVWNPAFFSPPVSPRSAYEGSLVSPSSGKQYYLALMIFASVSQFHIYLKCLQSRRLFSRVSSM